MFGQGLTQLQKSLNGKADVIQREFIAISDRLGVLARTIVTVEAEEKPALIAEQETLRERRAGLAEEINVWRDWAKDVPNQTGDDALRAYLAKIAEVASGEEAVQAAIKHVLFLLNATEEELAAIQSTTYEEKTLTPAGRLLKRASLEWDLRQTDPALRQTAALEFANRAGMVQDIGAITEVEAAIYDPDQFVREVALLTTINLHRFRAMRLANLDEAYQSVERLAQLNHPAVISALVFILESPRTGYVQKDGSDQPIEANNSRLRVAALKRLIEWHTPEARHAAQARQLDRDPEVSYLAQRALEAFPGEWNKPIRGTGLSG